MKLIDKNPPSSTGNVNQDIANLRNYLCYLQEQLNFILTLIDKQIGE